VRPTFIFPRSKDIGRHAQIQLESLRSRSATCSKQPANSQMLQCDVRADIRKMRIALEKIAKNTARRRRTRKVTA
jgi:hypothetical protein